MAECPLDRGGWPSRLREEGEKDRYSTLPAHFTLPAGLSLSGLYTLDFLSYSGQRRASRISNQPPRVWDNIGIINNVDDFFYWGRRCWMKGLIYGRRKSQVGKWGWIDDIGGNWLFRGIKDTFWLGITFGGFLYTFRVEKIIVLYILISFRFFQINLKILKLIWFRRKSLRALKVYVLLLRIHRKVMKNFSDFSVKV